MLICWQKINFILYVFLEILQTYCKPVILGSYCVPGYTLPNRYYQLAESHCIYQKAKNQLHPHVLLKILQRYVNFLFCLLWACLPMHTQNDSINLQNTSMFICKPKINFIIPFLLEILHFKESYNLIGQHFASQLHNQNFARYRTNDEISIIILVFTLDKTSKTNKTNFR